MTSSIKKRNLDISNESGRSFLLEIFDKIEDTAKKIDLFFLTSYTAIQSQQKSDSLRSFAVTLGSKLSKEAFREGINCLGYNNPKYWNSEFYQKLQDFIAEVDKLRDSVRT